MKKLLTATTALALVGGVAFAGETVFDITGDAEFALDYTSKPGAGMSKHSFQHEVGVDFTGSGTTDGGLTFGAKAGFDSGDSTVNTGTVHVSGAFGKITFGDNDAADLLAGGIADVGVNGVGVDDVVEGLRGTTAKALRYDHSFGSVAIAFSAGTEAGTAEVAARDPNEWTIIGADSREFVYTADPTGISSIFDIAFQISRTDAGVPQYGTTPLTNHGYARAAADADLGADHTVGEDGFVLDADGKRVPVADASAEITSAPAALEGEALTAFNNYIAAYSLGDDHVIGGTGDNEDMVRDLATGNGADAVPGTSSDNQYAFGMSFNAGGMTVGIGHDSNETTSLGLGFGAGDISASVLYVKADAATGMGGDVSYAMGASTLTLAYANRDPDVGAKMDAFGAQVAHDLGGGASIKAGFGQVDDVNRANIGMTFSF